MGNSNLILDSASLVIEHTVPKGKGLSFRWWHSKLTRSAKKYEGYLRTDLYAPIHGSQEMKWYSIIHFDKPEHLGQWIKSREREDTINSGSQVFSSYRFMSFATGLEGWFSRTTGREKLGLGPPAWKQNLAVVLGLYPVVILQTVLFSYLGLMQEWSLSTSMIVNNLISSSILTWAVMPFVTRLMGFWLYPASQPTSQKIDWFGTLILAGALGVMVVLFNSVF
ncbi:MAG: hypothetical protein NW224_14940 [Leptolyngbyaceae cyanobacterium bins.302]|nr:hypothetical protein [Leptolyngbyaceae cyanobacterium bins.302]